MAIRRVEFALQACSVLACIALLDACSSSPPVEELPGHSSKARPEWVGPPIEPIPPLQEPTTVEIYLDLSYPMAGFLPPASREDTLSTFHIITQNLGHHMARVYGGTDVTFRWRGIGQDLRELPSPPRLTRDLFTGRSTRLDLSVGRIVADFKSGRTKAAALVTDLMATGSVTGPLAVSSQLRDWLQSDFVRSGEFHIGLFGVEAEYWGVTHPVQCPDGPQLGCWYDERMQMFRRLESMTQFPAYVLVLGMGAEAVTSVMESLQRGIDEMGRAIESRWELMTRKSRGFDVVVSCAAGVRGASGERKPQFALSVDEGGQSDCVRKSTVTLFCEIDAGEDSFHPEEVRAIWATSGTDSPEGSGQDDSTESDQLWTTKLPGVARIRGTRLEVDVDCASIQSEFLGPIGLHLNLEVTGGATRPNNLDVDWSDWSTELATPGKTLHLESFIESVRIEPDRYRVQVPRLLRFGGPQER